MCSCSIYSTKSLTAIFKRLPLEFNFSLKSLLCKVIPPILPVVLIVYVVSIADNLIMDKYFIKKVGNRIKALRKEKGLSQDDLACDANISRSTISMIETARNDITLSKIKKIAKALDVEPYELLK